MDTDRSKRDVTTIIKSSYPPFVILDDIATNMRPLTTLKWIIACKKASLMGSRRIS